MYAKQRYLLHIGGMSLDLTSENITNAGKAVHLLDLKSKSAVKKQLNVELEHSTIFMGAVSFASKVYICGG